MSKKIIYVNLHDVFFIPGTGQLGPKLPDQGKTLADFEMLEDDYGGVLIEWTQGNYRCSASIPSAAIKVKVFEKQKVQPKPAK